MICRHCFIIVPHVIITVDENEAARGHTHSLLSSYMVIININYPI